MDLERHPVFREIELGPDLVENSLSDVAERSVEVVKYDQFANHVFTLEAVAKPPISYKRAKSRMI
jgi:hypothetical protein